MDHVFDGFLIILTQINDTSLSLSELVTACTIEESRA